jgi:hypothetical protein
MPVMTSRWLARALAGAAIVASAIGVARAAWALSAEHGFLPALMVVALQIGLPFAVLGFFAVGGRSIGAVWARATRLAAIIFTLFRTMAVHSSRASSPCSDRAAG